MVTATKNIDNSIVTVIFNEGKVQKSFILNLGGISKKIVISPQALQTIVIKTNKT
jgi:hypothetical protein